MSERYPDRRPADAGDFYVAEDECIDCGAPPESAPSLMIFPECGGCRFVKQPSTPAELFEAIDAMWVSCVGALYYGGSDPDIIRRLHELGLASQCDVAPRPLYREKIRRHCVVELDTEHPYGEGDDTALAIARLLAEDIGFPNCEVDPPRMTRRWLVGPPRARFEARWGVAPRYENKIEISVRRFNDAWWIEIERRPATVSWAVRVHRKLEANPHVRRIRWYADGEPRESGGEWPF